MVCVIPARGGSKRLPGKNIKELDGRPVIAYAIDAAVATGLFDDVYVSTDDVGIEFIALQFGARLLSRPKELGADDINDEQVIKWIMAKFEPNYLCYLYPTAALTTPGQIIRGLDACRALGGRISCGVRHSVFDNIDGQMFHVCKQIDAGQFYWIRGGDPIEDRGYIELDPMECQDVNIAEDWQMLEAKWMMRKLQR